MILCAVDESEAADRVIEVARWLADVWPAPLMVVHSVDNPDRDDGERLASIRARLGDPDVEPALIDGPPARAILGAADALGAELIAMGSRGHRGLRSAVLGSVSREVVSNAPCPVVIVPPGGAAGAGGVGDDVDGSIVCGVDGSQQALAAAVFAGGLAGRLKCRLLLVHARQDLKSIASYPGARSETPPITGQDDAVRRLEAEAIQRAQEAAGVTAVSVVQAGPPAEVLESVARREGAWLIVIAARGMGGVRAALLGSVAAELPATTTRPVVALSERAVASVLRVGP